MDTTKPVIKLDWTRLLGFDQATPQRRTQPASEDASDGRLTKLGAKAGNKKAQLSTGLRGLTKIGGKVGNKRAGRSGP